MVNDLPATVDDEGAHSVVQGHVFAFTSGKTELADEVVQHGFRAGAETEGGFVNAVGTGIGFEDPGNIVLGVEGDREELDVGYLVRKGSVCKVFCGRRRDTCPLGTASEDEVDDSACRRRSRWLGGCRPGRRGRWRLQSPTDGYRPAQGADGQTIGVFETDAEVGVVGPQMSEDGGASPSPSRRAARKSCRAK